MRVLSFYCLKTPANKNWKKFAVIEYYIIFDSPNKIPLEQELLSSELSKWEFLTTSEPIVLPLNKSIIGSSLKLDHVNCNENVHHNESSIFKKTIFINAIVYKQGIFHPVQVNGEIELNEISKTLFNTFNLNASSNDEPTLLVLTMNFLAKASPTMNELTGKSKQEQKNYDMLKIVKFAKKLNFIKL